ncbi:MAG: lipoyl(octanoyl) transferase LipB [Dictyoglomaceae bacterium]|nr:lipoyl(octanoyl) transferase LipB [Dictyoglomaceae bacterium]
MILKVLDLPCLEYRKAWDLQKFLHSYRVKECIPDVLILLEHPPVITLGRFGKLENLLKSREELERLKIDFYKIERGGDITYHGPGQLIGYFIFKIKSIKKLIFSVEESIQKLLKKYGINSQILEKYPGVWIEDKKICSIGMTVRAGVSFHGFALNITNDLTPFSYIIPCGLKDKKITSIYEETKISLPLIKVKKDFVEIFFQIYGFENFVIIDTFDDKVDQNLEKLLEVLKSP